MTAEHGELAPAASRVPELVSEGSPLAASDRARRSLDLVRTILARRNRLGITRIGAITRLDRVGIPVVQVARPLALSNAVTQGKGLHLLQAAVSALMETMETWAAERIPEARIRTAAIDAMRPSVRALYAPWVQEGAPSNWGRLPLAWLEGWDLFAAARIPVPAALVDTVYTLPSPHPRIFPRTTTGLGAGSTITEAIVQAGLEVLERHAVAQARRTPHFFDKWQVGVDTVRDGASGRILRRIAAAKLLAGVWRVPAEHRFPVYWCHVMEADDHNELAPLPAEGSGCDAHHDAALARALLEACQARLTAISGAREDVTRQAYPPAHDRSRLAEWRQLLARCACAIRFPAASDGGASGRESVSLDALVEALYETGARAALVVPLFSDRNAGIHVVRLVAPPLRQASQV